MFFELIETASEKECDFGQKSTIFPLEALIQDQKIWIQNPC